MSKTVWVAGEIDIDYNDEYHYPSGDDGGGIHVEKVFTDPEKAKAWCLEKNIAWPKGEGAYMVNDLAYDATYQERHQWRAMTEGEEAEEYFEPYGTYDKEIDWDALLLWCEGEGKDPWDYFPRIYVFEQAEMEDE